MSIARGPRTPITGTIANGAAISSVYDTGEWVACGFLMPAAWTAANVSFSVSHDGASFAQLYDPYGAIVSYTTPTAALYYSMDYTLFVPFRYIKFASGTVASGTNQAAERTVILLTRPM